MTEAIILGLVQGFSEFLPISSSGHVLLLQIIFGIQESGLAAAIHLGTCIAAIIYYHKDIVAMIKNATSRKESKALTRNIIFATIPAVVLAFIVNKLGIDKLFENMLSIGISSIFFASLLYLATRNFKPTKEISMKESIVIGLSQVIAAIIPGTSRSGITLTAGLFLGIKKDVLVQFIFLISIPITALAAANAIFIEKSVAITPEFLASLTTSFISGITAIHLLKVIVQKNFLKWLIVYRILFGIIAIMLGVQNL